MVAFERIVLNSSIQWPNQREETAMSRSQADALLEAELEAAQDVEEVDAAVRLWLWRTPQEQNPQITQIPRISKGV
jgi:hypothetical protein